MREISTKDALRYKFDDLMSKGAPSMIAVLGLITLVVVCLAALILSLTGIHPAGGEAPGLLENLWMSMMRAMDPGTVAGDSGWAFRLVMFGVTVFGIFVVSALISIISTGLDSRMQQMRKGRSFVVERDHVLILGWSTKIYTVISELMIANESQKSGVIVILAERDKVEMDDDLRSYIPPDKKTRIVTRSGCPTDLRDLDMVNPYHARSIIVLAPESETADAEIVKTILAITQSTNRRTEKYHIVAEMKSAAALQVAQMVGKDEVELIPIDDLIARITVQACRQSGLSVVYGDLMDFAGGEIYFRQFSELTGKSYAEILNRFNHSSVMGLMGSDKKVCLNPDPSTVLKSGDCVVALSEDDSTFLLDNGTSNCHSVMQVDPLPHVDVPERTLILGWNKKGSLILRELDRYVAKGSMVTVISKFSLEEDLEPLASEVRHVELSYYEADTSERQVLEQLHVNDFQHVVLLAYQEQMSVQQADATTLMTLLHLRDIWEKAGRPLKIVTEMLDLRNRDLATVTRADDFIVSDKLMSLLMCQVAENKYLMRVFDDLFHHDGSEIYIKPITNYLNLSPGQTYSYHELVNAAIRRGETAIGYRIIAKQFDKDANYGLHLNPLKSDRLSFTDKDFLLVLANS